VTTRGAVERELLAALDQVGFRSERIDLPAIWPAIASWWRAPAGDVADEDDRRTFYMALRPAAVPSGSSFAGDPPTAIAGVDLVCLEFVRQLVTRMDATAMVGTGDSAAVTLWYRADPSWERLRRSSSWIELGPSTPSLDWVACGRNVEWLIFAIEQSAVFDVASGQRALALEIAGDGAENLVVLANDGPAR
jgi:hypothetical protein